MKVLFFSWLKEEIGTEIYTLNVTHNLNIFELKKLLIKELGEKATILENPDIMCAVNLSIVNNDYTNININDEVAFYPPVTGG